MDGDVLQSPLSRDSCPLGVSAQDTNKYDRQEDAFRRVSQHCHGSLLCFLPQPVQTGKYMGIHHQCS